MKRKTNFYKAKAKQEEEDLVVLLLLNALKRKPSIRSLRSFKRKRVYKRRRAVKRVEIQDTGGAFIGPMEEEEDLPGVVTQDSQGEKRALEYDSDYEYENEPAHNIRAIE